MCKKRFYLSVLFFGLFSSAVLLAENYYYELSGRLSEVIFDDGQSIRYFYDKNGNIIKKVSGVEQLFANGFE